MMTKIKYILAFTILFSALAIVKAQGQTTTVQMQRDAGGTYTVPCKVNGLSMRFIFDTGASTVCISETEALFMFKNGYLQRADIKGKNYSQVASGDIVEGMTINLRTVEIGGLPLHNVEASVVHSLSAPLLFGQSAIQKLGPIKLDGDKLIIGKVSVLDTEQRKTKALDLNRRAYLADESGRSDEAIKLYNQANEIYPLANSYDGLSYIYSKLGKHEDAIKSSEQAVALEPSNDQYQYNYAVALYEGKRYDAAVQFFSTFYDNSIYKLSHKEAGGMPKEGIQSVVNACNYLGDIYYEKGMNQKAIEWLNKGIKLSRPIFGEDYYACLKLGDIAFNASI